MRPSIPQIALMSRLLDEALPLDVAGRRSWLETLSPEHQDLAPALRKALLPEDSDAADVNALETLPKFAFADAASGSDANGLQPGARVGPYELIRLLGAGGMALQWRYAALLGALGRLPEAVAAAKKATELDPLSAAAWTFLSLYLIESRQFAAAHEALRRDIEIQPESPIAPDYVGYLQLTEGNAAEALATFRRLNDEAGVVMAEHTLGHAKESQQALDQFIANGGQDSAYGLAQIHAWRGEKDKAFEWLDRAYQKRDSNLYDFRNDVALARLRGDPRFAAMLRKMNLPE